MTDTPERIWAFPKKDWFNAGASTKRITTAGAKDVCYVREDLYDAQAARIVELEVEVEHLSQFLIDAKEDARSQAVWVSRSGN